LGQFQFGNREARAVNSNYSLSAVLAARQLLRARNPELLAWSARQWDAWLSSQRRAGSDAGKCRVIIVVALTCLEDLPLHIGLLQLLALDGVRSEVIFRASTEAAANLLRAQARRQGWHLFVHVHAQADCDRLLSNLPATATLAVFNHPAALDVRPEQQPEAILGLGPPAALGFIGPADAYPAWRDAHAATETDFAAALRNLLALDPSKLMSVGNRKDSPSSPATQAIPSSVICASESRIDIPQPGPGDQLVLRTSSSDAFGRLDTDLCEPGRTVRLRMPASFLTKQLQPLGLEVHSADGHMGRTDVSFHVPASRLKPWMMTAFLNRGGAGNSVIRAFAEGIACRIAYAEDEPETLSDIPVVWGVLRESDRILAQAKAQQLYFFYIDHAYFNRGHGRSYRITRNGYEAGAIRRCPSDRLQALEVAVAPWRKGGREIIVCPPTEYFMRAHGCQDWLETTLQTLRRLTERPIVVREKPKTGGEVVPLPKALETAHALVTHSSNVAIEAACLGTPVFVSSASAAAPIGRTDLADIEAPVYPEREAWLAHLAYNQFSIDEIRDGSAWRMLLEIEERDLD
jgi:hypothetical protein